MTRISHVTFPHPVAKAPKHEREQSFSTAGGWSIERDDGGDFHIYGNDCDFWTDGSTSWVPMPKAAEVLREAYLEAKQEMEAVEMAAVEALKSAGLDVTKPKGKRRA